LDNAADEFYEASGFHRDAYYSDCGAWPIAATGVTRSSRGRRGNPSIEDTDDGYILDVELPGTTPDEVVVDLRGHRLRVSSGTTTTRDDLEIPLPPDADLDAVEASMGDGLLSVWIPRLWEDAPRRRAVHVQRAGSD
jgi:HSP20 family protein